MKQIFTIVLAVLASVLSVKFLLPQGGEAAAAKETAYERVMRTEVLRCGYAIWSPNLYYADANDKKSLTGYSFDVMNAVGKTLGLKVEWAEETGWGVAEQGLNSGRYDVVCNDVCLQPSRTKAASFSHPFVLNNTYFFVRRDLAGPRDDFAWLNAPDKTGVVLRNTILEDFTSLQLPLAKQMDASELSADMDILMGVAYKKADFGLSNLPALEKFMQANPNMVDVIAKPAGRCQSGFMLPPEDPQLKHMIDSALLYLNEAGKIEDMIAKYMPMNKQNWTVPNTLGKE
ncbi:MAG: transporter substrate-binding domain-containing protein [Alphaproteobacteria bacterium]